jgi:glycosyltransferase involved in cell wall biosynthesis
VSGERRGILFVHGADEWYGSDVVLYDIIRALEGTEFDPYVIVPDDIESELPAKTRLSGRLAKLGVPVYRLPLAVMRRRYMTPSGIWNISRRIRTSAQAILRSVPPGSIRLVHSHTATVLSGSRVAKLLGVPHVWHISEIVEKPAAVRYLLARTIERSSDRVVAVSHAVSDHLAMSAPRIARTCQVIHNAIDPISFANASGKEVRERLGIADGLVVGMLGRVGTWKGQEVLLRATPAILRCHERTTILLVGGVLDNRFEEFEKLRSLARDLGIASNVRIVGFEADAARVIAAMDVVVQPALRREPFGMPAVEAMAACKPVVASAHGGLLEIVSHGETGMLFPPGDSAALSDAVNLLLQDAGLRHRMGVAAQESAKSRFSIANFAAGYLQLYRSL